jgi:hypothetical protein
MDAVLNLAFFDTIMLVCLLLPYAGNNRCSCQQCGISYSLATFYCSQHCHPPSSPYYTWYVLSHWALDSTRVSNRLQDYLCGLMCAERLK